MLLILVISVTKLISVIIVIGARNYRDQCNYCDQCNFSDQCNCNDQYNYCALRQNTLYTVFQKVYNPV